MYKIGWIFYSESHRKKIETIVSLSKEMDTLDELGLGPVRDAFANLFFPGTTTIQTRAKYFLIVPWIIENVYKRNSDFSNFSTLLRKEEANIINILMKSEDQDGLIGKEARERLQRMPSSIYWSGLKKFDIITKDISLSQLPSYFRFMKKSDAYQSSARLTSEDKKAEDYRETKEDTYLVCDGLPKVGDLKKLNLKLSRKEAEFLKKKIIQQQPDSLMAFILRDRKEEFCLMGSFEEMVNKYRVFPNFSDDLKHALLFDEIMKGVYVRYNYKIAQMTDCPDFYKWQKRWNYYMESMKKAKIGSEMFLEIFEKFSIDNRVRDFCNRWMDLVNKPGINEGDLDILLVNRESSLKGASRARLSNIALAKKAQLPIGIRVIDSSPGVFYLNFRFHIAKKLVNDIFQGLNNIEE